MATKKVQCVKVTVSKTDKKGELKSMSMNEDSPQVAYINDCLAAVWTSKCLTRQSALAVTAEMSARAIETVTAHMDNDSEMVFSVADLAVIGVLAYSMVDASATDAGSIPDDF